MEYSWLTNELLMGWRESRPGWWAEKSGRALSAHTQCFNWAKFIMKFFSYTYFLFLLPNNGWSITYWVKCGPGRILLPIAISKASSWSLRLYWSQRCTVFYLRARSQQWRTADPLELSDTQQGRQSEGGKKQSSCSATATKSPVLLLLWGKINPYLAARSSSG